MSAPNAFYQQHHQVEAPVVDERHFRTAWKILTRIDGLLVEKWITTAEFHAAADFRELYQQAQPRGARSTLAGLARGGSRASLPEPLVNRLDAWNRLRVIQTAIGRRRYDLLVLSVVEDTPWKELGRRFRIDHRTARNRVAEAIRHLAVLTGSVSS